MCFHAVDLVVYLFYSFTVCIMYQGMPKAQKTQIIDNLISLLRHIYVIWPSIRKTNRKPSSLENTSCGQKQPHPINLTLRQRTNGPILPFFFFFVSIIACRAKNKLVQHQDKSIFQKLRTCSSVHLKFHCKSISAPKTRQKRSSCSTALNSLIKAF